MSLAERVKEATAPNSLEAVFKEEGIHRIIGVDEVGMGPLAGPVVAAACCFTLPVGTFSWEKRIRDSKKLKAHVREELAEEIRKVSSYYVGEIYPGIIDKRGITQANQRAMRLAIEGVLKDLGDDDPDLILIDGKHVPQGIEGVPKSCRIIALPKADDRSEHVGAASIIAKVQRDAYMTGPAHEKWPEYDFASNKGYGTKAHRAAIEEHGPCHIHRLTFGCVKEHAHRVRKEPATT